MAPTTAAATARPDLPELPLDAWEPTNLRVPYSEVGCWSFQAGHHLVATYSPNRVRAFSRSISPATTRSSRWPRSSARCLARARCLVRKMPAQRCRLPSC